MYIIGIDPGISGGIVALNGKTGTPHIVDISPMPAGPHELLAHFVYLGFPGVSNRTETRIFIENVHSMPTDGVRAAFTFGQGLGRLEGVMAALGLPEPLKVNPKQWMDYSSMKRNTDEKKYDFKKRIKELAVTLVPKDWKDKITLKTCDAYMIAMYGWNTIKQQGDTNGDSNSLPVSPTM